MARLEISGGHVVDPANGVDAAGSVFIDGGRVASVLARPDGFVAERTLDASGRVVCPGLVDLSVRLREPGHSSKGTFATETRAAAAAGVTSLCLQPDTRPVIDAPAVAELIKELAHKAGYRNIYPIAALTQRLEGNELSAMLSLKQAGCIAVGNAGRPIANLLILRRAMEYAASHGLTLMCRPNDHWLGGRGCAHEGKVATRYGLPSIPDTAETIAVDLHLELAMLTGCRVHFGQLSCRRAVIKIQQAQKYGMDVSADVAIHQLHLTEDDMVPFDSHYHVLPPLRTRRDLEFLRQGLAGGVIGSICSDHQPHDLDAKLGAFPETEPGMSALETLLPLTLGLVTEHAITLSQAVAALTQRPAAILGLDAGALTPGKPADICIFDRELEWRVDAANWLSKGVNTPFWGRRLRGRVTETLQAGEVIHSLPAACRRR